MKSFLSVIGIAFLLLGGWITVLAMTDHVPHELERMISFLVIGLGAAFVVAAAVIRRGN